MQVTIDLEEDFEAPDGPIATPDEYLAFVLNMAVRSWKEHLAQGSIATAIAAALAEYNAAFPEPTEDQPAE